jgi:hypothetical protein
MISRPRGRRSMSMTFLSSSAVHVNPFCISIYQYIQVCTGTYKYVLVHTFIYEYVLVRTGMYWYVPVFRSDLVEQELTWGKPFELILAHCFMTLHTSSYQYIQV